MKFKTVYLIFVSFLILDLVLTFIALNFLQGNYEVNPISRYLFDTYGVLGYFLQFFWGSFILFFFVLFLYNLDSVATKIQKYGKKFFGIREEKVDRTQIRKFSINLGLILFSVSYLLTIINNLIVIFSSLQ